MPWRSQEVEDSREAFWFWVICAPDRASCRPLGKQQTASRTPASFLRFFLSPPYLIELCSSASMSSFIHPSYLSLPFLISLSALLSLPPSYFNHYPLKPLSSCGLCWNNKLGKLKRIYPRISSKFPGLSQGGGWVLC